jgi:hypothetical protein
MIPILEQISTVFMAAVLFSDEGAAKETAQAAQAVSTVACPDLNQSPQLLQTLDYECIGSHLDL